MTFRLVFLFLFLFLLCLLELSIYFAGGVFLPIPLSKTAFFLGGRKNSLGKFLSETHERKEKKRLDHLALNRIKEKLSNKIMILLGKS